MPATYEPIATTTLSSAASSITFSSIPNTYTDLKIVLTGTNTLSNRSCYIRFNSNSATNYSYTGLYGDGTTAGSYNGTSTASPTIDWSGLSSTIPQTYQIDIFSYAGSTYKTFLSAGSEDRNGSGATVRVVGLWRSTSAINTVSLSIVSANFNTGTTATIWGIKAA